MTVYETDLPGVGRKFELELDGGERVVVIVHHDGRREVFRRPSREADSVRLFDLTGREARQLATLLQGVDFPVVDITALEAPIGEAIIEWVDVDPDSPLAGRSLGDADLRRRTGVSVIAIQRGEETVPNPSADVEIEDGDVLVTLGTRQEQAAFLELVG